MRDWLIITIILGSLPFCFARPSIGIFMWYWVALMNPHRHAWGFAVNFPVAQCIGIATLAGMFLSYERKWFPKEREIFLLLFLWVLFTVNTTDALFPEGAWKAWSQVSKILLMTLVTLMVITDRTQLRYLLIIISLSIGVYAVKGVPWGIATGGEFMLRGPDRSFIASNNDIGIALNMIMPITFFLAKTETNKWVRRMFFIVFFSSIFGVFLTYSRGALLGLLTVLAMIFLKAKQKVVAFVVIGVTVSLAVILIPDKWMDRMDTIVNYEQDGSALSRIETWKWAWSLAVENPLTGGGFDAFRANPSDFDGHSVYFGLLAEQGFIAFGVFALLIISCYFSLWRIKRVYAGVEGMEWYADCSRMLQVSFLAYLVNGLTLNHQYFDLMYVLVAVTILVKALVKSEQISQPSPSVSFRKSYDKDGTKNKRITEGELKPIPTGVP